MEHKNDQESPSAFWKWSTYATIAAVLRDNCYWDRGTSRLYPNIYVLFYAKSGARKGPPINFTESLLHNTNATKIISGRSSIQAILDELSRAETDKTTGKIMKAGSAIFCAQEFAAGLVADPAALEILTDIYDYKTNPYKNRLRSGPCFNLDRIVFTMFAGSNEAMIKNLFNQTAINGGMLARTFVVIANEDRPPNSLMYVDIEKDIAGFKTCQKALQEIVDMPKGPFIFDEAARKEYHDWYNGFRKDYKNHKDPSGVIGRIHTGVVKIAMILAANCVSLQVTRRHVDEAIAECVGLLPNYNTFIMGSGKSTTSTAGQIVLTELFLAKNKKKSKREIIREHWMDFDSKVLDELVVQLESAGIIRTLVEGATNIFYQLTEEGVAIMETGMTEKMAHR